MASGVLVDERVVTGPGPDHEADPVPSTPEERLRFLCTSDSHIGAGRDLAPDRLAEQEQVWRRILQIARDEHVDAVLHLGDMWERRKPAPDEYLAAERPLVEHRDYGGPPVLVVAGNHDRSGVEEQLALQVLERAGLIQLSTRPEVFKVGGGFVERNLAIPNMLAVATLPWTPVSRLVAAQDGGDRERVFQDAAELLLQTAHDLRRQVDGPAILAVHWSVSGASLPTGLPTDMLGEVVLPLAGLEALGFDAIVMGHIHRAQELVGSFAGPMSFYVGSPIPLNFGEATSEHGVWILDSRSWRAEFLPLKSRRFETVQYSDLGTESVEVLTASFLKVRGRQGEIPDLAEVREALLSDTPAERVWFDLTAERLVRDRGAVLDTDLTDREQLAAYLQATGSNGDMAVLLERAERYLEEAQA